MQNYLKIVERSHLFPFFLLQNKGRRLENRAMLLVGRELENRGAENLRLSPRSLRPFRKSDLGKTRS